MPHGMARDWERFAPAERQMAVKDRIAREVWRDRTVAVVEVVVAATAGGVVGGVVVVVVGVAGGGGSSGGGGGPPGDDGPGGGGGGGSGGDGEGNRFDYVSRADESALMVLCDRSYVRPITYADLTRPEKIKADLWFQNEERRRRRTLTDEEHDRRMGQISEKVRNVSLVRELPDYKCSARPLSKQRGQDTSAKRRAEVEKANGRAEGEPGRRDPRGAGPGATEPGAGRSRGLRRLHPRPPARADGRRRRSGRSWIPMWRGGTSCRAFATSSARGSRGLR